MHRIRARVLGAGVVGIVALRGLGGCGSSTEVDAPAGTSTSTSTPATGTGNVGGHGSAGAGGTSSQSTAGQGGSGGAVGGGGGASASGGGTTAAGGASSVGGAGGAGPAGGAGGATGGVVDPYPFVPASEFNKSGLKHSANGAGVPVDHTRNGQPITTYDADHRSIGTVEKMDGPTDANGNKTAIRVQTLEVLHVDSKDLWRIWPGGTSHAGWVESDDVATTIPYVEEPQARAGNGAPCGQKAPALPTASGPAATYRVRPLAMQAAAAGMTWKVQASTGEWEFATSGWDKLHDPAAGPVPRAPLMWSWTVTDADGLNQAFKGGGVIRNELREDEPFIPCHVTPIRMALREAPAVKGTAPDLATARTLYLYAAYGKYASTTKNLHGWLLVAERLAPSGPCVLHVACSGGPGECPLVPLPKSCQF